MLYKKLLYNIEFHLFYLRTYTSNIIHLVKIYYDIYHCCVCSEKLLTMERGTVRNM